MTKQGRGKRIILTAAVLIVLLISGALLLSRLKMHSAQAGMMLTNTTSPVVGALPGKRSYCDQGIFLLSATGGTMRFYDYEFKAAYIMCGENGCTHSSADCPAWYDARHPVQGLAAYQGTIYGMFWNEDIGAYDLCSLQMDGTQRTVAASLPLGNSVDAKGTVSEDKISDIVYSGGHAWITVSHHVELDSNGQDYGGITGYQVPLYYGVDLAAGRLFQVELPAVPSIDSVFRFEIATDDLLIFTAIEQEQLLSWDEFEAAYAQGAYQDLETSDLTPTLYDAYYYAWSQADAAYTYYCYDIASGKINELESGMCLDGYLGPYMFAGEYEGSLLIEDYNDQSKQDKNGEDPYYRWDRQNGNFLWNLKTGEKTLLFNGPMILVSQYNNMSGHITAEDEIIHMQFFEDKHVEVYAYSIKTGQDRFIYTYAFDDGPTFSIESETPTQFIGTYKDKLCAIDKEDYNQGAFEKSVRLGTF